MNFSYLEPNVLNVFTDASTSSGDDKQNLAVGSGFILVNQDQIIGSDVVVFPATTSAFGELYAVFMGVSAIYTDVYTKRYYGIEPQYQCIYNLFSDSLYAIQAIRSWIIGWMKKAKPRKAIVNENGQTEYQHPILTNSEGKIKHQECLLHIVDTIIASNVHINLYHIKGHMNPEKEYDINKAMNLFVKCNKDILKGARVPKEYIQNIIYWNNKIDIYSRKILYATGVFNKEIRDKLGKFKWPIEVYPTREQQCLYQKLVQ